MSLKTWISARCLLFIGLVSTAVAPSALARAGALATDVADSGQTREIHFTTNEGTWMSVDISPDGLWVVFDLLGHIYRVSVEGGQAQCLTQNTGGALNFHPRYSPDGSMIAFVSDRGGQNNLWVMNTDGSTPRPIFLDPITRITQPAWMPDGKHIIAVRSFPTYSMHRRSDRIWKFALDGGQREELVGAPSGTQAYWPSASPDGKYIYYHHSTFAEPLHGRQRDQQIRRLDLTTGEIALVTPPAPPRVYWNDGPIAFAPEVSPDGRWLAFARRMPGGAMSYRDHVFQRRTALWLRDLQTGTERVLMDPITLDMAEAHAMKNLRILPGYSWAKDSQSLVISQGGKLRRVWVEEGLVETVPFQARVHRIMSETARSHLDIRDDPMKVRFIQWPTSIPDGKMLIFQAAGWIWRMELPDGEPSRLTSGNSDSFEFMPAASPDGQWVAFVTWNDEEQGHLWKAPTTGGKPERITIEAGEYLHPVWSPDGRSILVTRGGNSTARGLPIEGNLSYDLVRVPASGGEAKSVMSSASIIRASFGPEGRIFYRKIRGGGNIQVLLAQGKPASPIVSVLRSIDPEGNDVREHLAFSAAAEIVPSPDGKWVALRKGFNVFVVPFLQSAATYSAPLTWVDEGEALHIDMEQPNPNVKSLTDRGGIHVRWRTATTLEFVSGNRYYSYDVQSERADAVEIRFRLPRNIPEGMIALTGGRIITLDEGEVIERGTLLVEKNRIRCIGLCDASRADRIFDVTGKTIIPGFVDVHAHHLGFGSGLIPPHRYQSALYLAYGVTTTLDPSADPETAFATSELIETGRLVGPRTYTTGEALMPFSPSTGFRDYEEAKRTVRRLASWGAISIKDFLQPRRDQRQWVAEAARKHGVSLTAEGADLFYNISLILDGHAGWEHPLMYAPLYSDATQFFGRAGAVYSPTLVVAGAGYWAEEYFQSRSDLWKDPKQRRFVPWTRLVRSIGTTRRPLREYSFPIIAEGVADIIRAGGTAAIGGHGEQTGLDSHWEVWIYTSALEPMEALQMASLGGAYFLGLEDDLGSIKVGKLADLMILNSNPLDDIHNTLDIEYVMKGGMLYDAETLNELWPEKKSYGPIPWINPDVLTTDERPVDYWDRQGTAKEATENDR